MIAWQVPQLVENFRNKKADALSAWFLVDWLMVWKSTLNQAQSIQCGSANY